MGPPEAAAGRGVADTVEKWATAAALASAAALAWAWLLSHGDPALGGMMAGHAAGSPWRASYLLPGFAMWTLMMVAMMLPSAAPMILLYRKVAGPSRAALYTAIFVAAYLAIWAAFSALAVLGQAALVSSGAASEMTLTVGDRRIAAGLLILAAAYQLTPLKQACLDSCRSPLAFILRLSRPGWRGTLRVGLAHGLYCLGCCWALMLLLFVGGVMNLAWVGLLALVVAFEKLAPPLLKPRIAVGAALAAGGIALSLQPG